MGLGNFCINNMVPPRIDPGCPNLPNWCQFLRVLNTMLSCAGGGGQECVAFSTKNAAQSQVEQQLILAAISFHNFSLLCLKTAGNDPFVLDINSTKKSYTLITKNFGHLYFGH